MSEAKFTPGPWKHKKGRKSHHEWGCLFTAKRGRVFLFGCEGLSDADSHLIAAAPDLYYAIKKMQKIILDDDLQETVPPLFWEISAAALTKARGES